MIAGQEQAERMVPPRNRLIVEPSPCWAMIRAAMLRPSPVPPALVVKKGSNSRSCTSGAMPPPVSLTSIRDEQNPPPSVVRVPVSPGGDHAPSWIASAEFWIKLTSTWRSCSGSASTDRIVPGGRNRG